MANLFLVAVMFTSIATLPTVEPLPKPTYCPKDQSIIDFNIKKILGDWHIVELSSTIRSITHLDIKPISCQSFNIKENGNTSLLTHHLGDKSNKHSKKYNIIEEDRNLAEDKDEQEIRFAIPETDYENYALAITCKKSHQFHRTAYVLVKDLKSKSNEEYIERAHIGLKAHNFDVQNLVQVSHENCH